MAKRSASLLFLFFSLIVTLFSYMECAGNINFAFPPQTDIKVDPDAYFEGDTIQLTRNEFVGDLGWSVGWATYNQSVPLWDNSSGALASFTSHFQFLIRNSSSNSADGLTFFIAPFDFKPPANSWGEWLGLFNLTTDGILSNQVVAVEFDTFQNSFDPDDNHVGIDVNSAVSVANVSLSSEGKFLNNTLKNGQAWDSWVDYNGSTKQLQVFLLYNPSANLYNISKPRSPILSYHIDLRDYIPEIVTVGLSASTGLAFETHTVSAWNFSCTYSWDISSAPSRTRNSSWKIILISLFVCLLVICCFLFIAGRWYFKQREARRDSHGEELDEQLDQGYFKFSYGQLREATRNFSDDEILGRGGFGGVYRGILPTTSETVAIKRIGQGSRQGRKEYISEVTIITKLRHRNLVRLLGWCHEQGELLLVYEFLPNGSLDKYIFDERKDCLNWERRYSVARGIASALIYLHEEWDQRVVHRDVKASNVLLDSNFNAKLGDFGLARVVEFDHAASRTTVVAGTRGYMAPEYIETGKASPESDVYSFGAVALEISCGRQPIDYRLEEYDLRVVAWVWDLRRQGKLLDAADKKLEGNFNSEEMELLMLVGLLCSHPDPKARPTMREVLKILEFDSPLPFVPLNMPVPVYADDLSFHAGSSLTNFPSERSRGEISGRLMSDREAR
ncbi:L-type lectin-domain containing receptor kinase IX.1-like [Cryptomeria japonica]|uniref:L-type lectin-domain containing receptor kinase IX.1-like n=1 Tax=Cryptomeria japonica TaxID=3369 RepID=UPI0027D9DE46|nr:L-type lectin-domain containing receptor kinase IX.1-like [Cryptomeria japonica]XP_059072364.1 L-type lectin-domain containing receptor kinase IX.1-like [Cryptomeria japonica]